MSKKLSIEQVIAAVDAGNPNAMFENAPAEAVSKTAIEVTVVGKRCVYVNDYRVAGGKPYYSESLSSHNLKCSIGDVLEAFSEEQILAAVAERKARRDYFADYHAARKQQTPCVAQGPTP